MRRMLTLMAAAIVLPRGAAAAPAPELPSFDATTSLLVVSPHPDDETLCCGGIIQRVMHAGGRVAIVWITSGDGSELDSLVIERSLRVEPQRMRELGKRRMREARTAATLLGVASDRLFFLGYPDRGIQAILNDNYVTPYLSPFTGTTQVPYSDAAFPGHPYTGASLEADFATVLERTNPTLILAPSPLDMHTDHSATGVLTMRMTNARHDVDHVRYWIVHGGGGWPTPRGLDRELDMTPPPRARSLALMSLRLEPTEVDGKLQAIHSYQTQLSTMASFLLAFARRTELFSSTPVPPPRSR